jgi:CheY-like chemotaxis protein
MESKPTILLVEDNEEDAFLLQRALRLHKIDCGLQIATDGEVAIDYLAGNGKYGDRSQYPFPTLMLLDLKLPCVHGFDVLAWITAQPAAQNMRTMQTIVLTSSGEDRDREKAEQFGVRSYFLKPPTAELIAEVVSSGPNLFVGREIISAKRFGAREVFAVYAGSFI